MLRSTCVFAVVLAAAGFTAQASTLPADAVKVRIEQSFRAGETWLPAGSYSIRPLAYLDAMPVLVVENEHGNRILVPASRVYNPVAAFATNPTLVFDRTDGKLILKAIWSGGGNSGFSIIGSPNHEAAPALLETTKQAAD